jgi:sortase (surface protein transpeptidase)
VLRSSATDRGRRVRAGLAAGLATIGLLLIWSGLGMPSAGDSAVGGAPPVPSTSSASFSAPEPTHGSRSTSGRSSASTEETDVRDSVTGLILPESDPVAMSIPTIGVRSGLVELGLDADGAMEIPRDPADAGWFVRGAAPGALGPAVIAGHVTWDGAPGVFYRLGTMRRGDRVLVTREDGRTAVFGVDRVARYSKSRFPTRTVYGAIDHAGLRLITCGGTYDKSRHRYVDNVVVFARLLAVREPRS